ncbi:multisubunit potassium/proton antiporter, PhaE subunit [Stigmatella aurantiaca]|uniref:Multisubunit potassium/proton antiporter, PhaE subunit n=1 Tax=Stigmatella aurantiaca TaxID=41 RepID=A0A1H7MXV0_STIAU|nr:Na+/H+ antiporter subunit E [Stigmatella aurantiaca]SEL16090.1 multisubunit potassium/proton antiporter, PhaE subunit [Stigmatella aurantiaca]
MRRLIPSPVLSVALLLLWILLMQSVSAGTLVLGVVLALFWPAVTVQLRPAPVRLRKPLVMARLFCRVAVEMLRSNAEVAWAILTQQSRGIRSGFVLVPLELKDPNGLAVLAVIVTFTPGTAWAQLSADNRVLLLHVLAIQSEAELVAFIKQRYERPLKEIFE